jgi:hypothetical protein
MKPQFLHPLLLAAAAPALLLGGNIHAASTGNVTLTATVPVACNLTVTPAVGATISNLTTGATNLLVATVAEVCNAPNGYTVDVAATNSGSYTGLFRDTVSNDSQAFSINYNGSNLTGARVTNVNVPGTSTKDVRISYPSNANLTATTGPTYTETLGFTITAK